MGNSLNNEVLRSEVKNLISGINAYFTEQNDVWEKKTREWVLLKADELFPGGDRQHLAEKLDKDTPRQLLQQLSDEWPVEDGIVDTLIADIKSKIEVLKESLGDGAATEIVDETKSWLNAKAAQLVRVEFERYLNTLDWMYDNAKEVTIMEFLTRSNYQDVISYHEELNKVLWEMHFEAVEWHQAKILSEVAKGM